MSNFQPDAIVTQLFNRIRQEFDLGLREYLAALDAVKGGYGADNLADLERVLQALWCHSLKEQQRFAAIWKQTVATNPSKAIQKTDSDPNPAQSVAPPQSPEAGAKPSPEKPLPQPEERSQFKPLPVQSPPLPGDSDRTLELRLYFPVSRRAMTYCWRYLRRPVADGPADVLDVQATVDRAAHQGFLLAPVYRRRQVNRAHLLLLIDQDGSMTPFHRFTRDLVETAQNDSTLERVDVCYFHNVPPTNLYQDARLTSPVSTESVIATCDLDTSVLIVSDAGAARGYRRMERIRETAAFLNRLKQTTTLISWLNPMPKERWWGTSAEVIYHLVAMQQMDNDGLSNAIDIVRGQSLSHLYSGV